MNQIVILEPRYTRNRITIDVASDANIAAFGELILSYRYVRGDRYCEKMN